MAGLINLLRLTLNLSFLGSRNYRQMPQAQSVGLLTSAAQHYPCFTPVANAGVGPVQIQEEGKRGRSLAEKNGLCTLPGAVRVSLRLF